MAPGMGDVRNAMELQYHELAGLGLIDDAFEVFQIPSRIGIGRCWYEQRMMDLRIVERAHLPLAIGDLWLHAPASESIALLGENFERLRAKLVSWVSEGDGSGDVLPA